MKNIISNSGTWVFCAPLPSLSKVLNTSLSQRGQERIGAWQEYMKKPKRIVISSTQEVLSLNQSFALLQNISPPGQSLTCQQGNCQGKDSSALLLAAPLPFIIISRKGFLLSVNGIRSSKASRCWGSGSSSLCPPWVSSSTNLPLQQAVTRKGRKQTQQVS